MVFKTRPCGRRQLSFAPQRQLPSIGSLAFGDDEMKICAVIGRQAITWHDDIEFPDVAIKDGGFNLRFGQFNHNRPSRNDANEDSDSGCDMKEGGCREKRNKKFTNWVDQTKRARHLELRQRANWHLFLTYVPQYQYIMRIRVSELKKLLYIK